MKTTPLIIAIAVLATALVASIMTRSSASAPQQAPSASAATSAAAPQPLAAPQPKPPRRLGALPDAMRDAVQTAILDVNITGPTASKAFAAFQKASPEIKADRAARSKLAAAIGKAASHFAESKLEPGCFVGTIDQTTREACAKRGKLWGLTDGGEVEAQ